MENPSWFQDNDLDPDQRIELYYSELETFSNSLFIDTVSGWEPIQDDSLALWTPSTQFFDVDIQQDPQQPSIRGYFLGTETDAKLIERACRANRLPFYHFPPEESAPLAGSIYALDAEDGSLLCPDPALWVLEHKDGGFCVFHSTKDISLKRKDATVVSDNKFCQIISYYSPWQTVNGELIQPTKCDWFLDDPLYDMQSAMVPLPAMEQIRMRIEQLGEYQSIYKQLVMLTILGWAEESNHPSLMNQNRPLLFPHFSTEDEYWLTLSRSPTFVGKSHEELRVQTESVLSLFFQAAAAPIAFPFFMDRSFSPLQNRDIFFEIFQVGVPSRETFSWPGGVMLDRTARLFGTPRDCLIEEEDDRLVAISSAFRKPHTRSIRPSRRRSCP